MITFGVFDLLHYGHFELFRRAHALGGPDGRLIVAIQRDEWVTRFKDVKLVYDFERRRKMIGAIRYVDEVVSYTAVDETIKELDFDIFVCGPDQCHAGFQRAKEWCAEVGREVVVLERTAGISSTQLRGPRP